MGGESSKACCSSQQGVRSKPKNAGGQPSSGKHGGLWEGEDGGEKCASDAGPGETPAQYEVRKAETVKGLQARAAAAAKAVDKRPPLAIAAAQMVADAAAVLGHDGGGHQALEEKVRAVLNATKNQAYATGHANGAGASPFTAAQVN